MWQQLGKLFIMSMNINEDLQVCVHDALAAVIGGGASHAGPVAGGGGLARGSCCTSMHPDKIY